ncbi:MAG: CHAT domain-containing protein [Acidobacteria bacterium]|nr:CHAT domain-containing protein [Acidobacteriota bacterium]
MKTTSFVRIAAGLLAALLSTSPIEPAVAARPGGTGEKDLLAILLEASTTGGEAKVRVVATARKKTITRELILQIADAGVRDRDERSLDLARVLADVTNDARSKADVLSRRGDYGYFTSDFTTARQCLEKAEAIYAALNDLSGMAHVKRRTADMLSRTGQNDQSQRLLDEARALYERAADTRGLGGVCLSRWYAAFVAGDFDTARKMLDEALALFTSCQDGPGQAATLRSIGFMHGQTGENEEALTSYERSLALFSQLDDSFGQGNVLRGSGDVYAKIGESEKALDMYGRALPHLDRIRDLRGQAYLYASMGSVWKRRGDLKKSREMFEQAQALFVRTGDLLGQGESLLEQSSLTARSGDNERAMAELAEAHSLFVQAGDLYGQANTLVDTAAIHSNTGEIPASLAKLLEALPIFRKVEDPTGEGNVYLQMGDLYFTTGDLERARSLYAKAMPFYEKADLPPDQGNIHLRLGDIFFKRQDYAQAAEEFDSALILFTKAGDPLGQAYALFRQGATAIRLDQSAKAADTLDKALPLFFQTRELAGEGNVYEARADIAERAQDHAKALQWAAMAEELYRKIGDPAAEQRALFLRARALKAKRQEEDAADLYRRGLALLEKLRSGAGFAGMKRSFMESAIASYEEAAGFFLEINRDDIAFRTAESMKARAFLDTLAEALVDLERGVPPELRKRRADLQNQIGMLGVHLQEELGKESPDERSVASIRSEIEKVEAQAEDLSNAIRMNNPQYASVKYPAPLDVRRLQNEVLSDNEVLLEYVLLKNDARCFVVSRNDFAAVKLPVTAEALEQQVRSWLLRLSKPQEKIQKEPAEALGRMLIEPLAKWIRGKKLIIVPDGALARLPFETLRSGGKYLVEQYDLSYVQSASVLDMLRKQHTSEGTAARFVGFGDPVYDYEDFKAGRPEKGSELKGATTETSVDSSARDGYLTLGGRLDRIEGSGAEVSSVAAIFRDHGLAAATHLRLDATEAKAKSEEVEKADIIHFSAHGILTERVQAIALSQIPGDAEDGFLTLGEIMSCRYQARLVVLSACETGLGRTERGEGIIGLTRAVMYAGSSAALVSLWNVSDIGTKELMTRFYSHMLKDGLSTSDALRAAKLDLMRHGAFKHPFFWGAFVLYGGSL